MAELSSEHVVRRCILACERFDLSQQAFIDESELSWTSAKVGEVFSFYKQDVIESKKKGKQPRLSAAEIVLMKSFLQRREYLTDVDAQVKSIAGLPDNLYFAMLGFLGYHSDTERETKVLAEGRYRLFRASLKLPDMFTVGLLNVTRDPASDALRVREMRRYKQVAPTAEERDAANHGNLEAQLKVSLEHERSIHEEYWGYLLRKRRRYICIERAKVEGNTNFLFTIYQDEFMEGDGSEARIASLGGVSFGTAGSRVYVSRVYLERCPDEETLEEIENESNYFPVRKIKPSVVAYLRMPTPSNDFYQIF